MNNVIQMPTRKCIECGARATKEVPLVDMETGAAFSKLYCDAHYREPLDRDQLALLIDLRDAEIERLRKRLLAITNLKRPETVPICVTCGKPAIGQCVGNMPRGRTNEHTGTGDARAD